MQMNSALFTRLTIIEDSEPQVILDWSPPVPQTTLSCGSGSFSTSARALRLKGRRYGYMARTLHQGHEVLNNLVLLPALEEIQLDKNYLSTYEIERAQQLAAFQPFVSTRQQAGRPSKGFFGQ